MRLFLLNNIAKVLFDEKKMQLDMYNSLSVGFV